LTLLTHPVDAAGFALTRRLHITSWITDVTFQTVVEPAPDPNSRVTLSDECDALGIPRAKVAWKLGSLVRRTFDRTWAVLADELQRSGVAEDVTLDPTIEDQEWPPYHIGARHHMMSGDVMVAHQDNAWPRHPEWTWHHMGTTRMHDSPKHGVVDRNCLVHGMSNLYIAGSSVFPTAAANFPTMTITALTLRLSKHIARVVREPVARVEEPSPLVCVAGA
jgi:choline dehydrogenase-like flavoprotein